MSEMRRKWQKYWDRERKGQQFYNIQKNAGETRKCHWRNKAEDISQMRFERMGLIGTLFMIQKHDTGNCVQCELWEIGEQVFIKVCSELKFAATRCRESTGVVIY